LEEPYVVIDTDVLAGIPNNPREREHYFPVMLNTLKSMTDFPYVRMEVKIHDSLRKKIKEWVVMYDPDMHF